MNKIHNINLGGYPFTIDEDAFDRLNDYLRIIENHFSTSEGCEEILTDIEYRLAEIFNEQMEGSPIVNRRIVENAIQIMGTPEEFGADETVDEEKKADESFTIQTGKRLYRDPDNEVIGGVASGIAAYFGIADPIWVRIAFVLLAVFGAFGIPLYIILWIIMPKAETAGAKLAMRGEPINVSSIARKVEEEIEDLSDRITEFGHDLGGRKKKAKAKQKTWETV